MYYVYGNGSLVPKCRGCMQLVYGKIFKRDSFRILQLSAARWHVLWQGLVYTELSICFLFPRAARRKGLSIFAGWCGFLCLRGKVRVMDAFPVTFVSPWICRLLSNSAIVSNLLMDSPAMGQPEGASLWKQAQALGLLLTDQVGKPGSAGELHWEINRWPDPYWKVRRAYACFEDQP